MRISVQRACLKATVDATLESFSRRRYRVLAFPHLLEDLLEQDTRIKRSHRMWIEGLIAILGFNLCLLLDYHIVKDNSWLQIVRHTALVTPVAVIVNIIVLCNPPRRFREGSVAAGMFVICLINLVVEGNASAVSTLFGAICVLIAALFVGVVMRLRFRYVLVSLSAMLLAGVWSLGLSSGLRPSEAIIGDSMLAVGIILILVASLSLEVEERNSYLIRLQQSLQDEELAWANQALRELSNIDNLTNLPNRRALDERVELLWKACAERNVPLSTVVIDVDHFKHVNDAHGHLFGDKILRLIATILPQAFHSADDMAARFGGEEFVLLLPGAKPEKATAIAERVRYLVETSTAPANTPPDAAVILQITVSCGVSTTIPGSELQWNNLIAAADEALYTAKRGGRNRVEFRSCAGPDYAMPSIINPTSTRASRIASKLPFAPLVAARQNNPISRLISRL